MTTTTNHSHKHNFFCSFFGAYTEFLGCLYLLLYVACRQGICYLFMFFLLLILIPSSSFKFIIRLSSLCKSLLVFLLVMFHPLYYDQKRNETTRRNVMRFTENWMQKNMYLNREKNAHKKRKKENERYFFGT